RVCNKIKPSQINTAGLTHLYYSFVFFHPTTFEITPMKEANVPLYKEFTDLKTDKLRTWVAIGGVSDSFFHSISTLIHPLLTLDYF
ncbi:hypothetical protein EJ02DRAFT_356176, partial [Clathrospora elynae]